MDADGALSELRRLARPCDLDGMARYGIRSKVILGVRTPDLVALARRIGKDHRLALALWRTGVYEARHLAVLVDEPDKVTEAQMERWAGDFDNWAICDGTCLHLFDRTRFAHGKALEWTARDEEFVKRAGFALMAVLAVHDKEAPDSVFLAWLPVMARESTDERPYVRKAVNWALRQVGKRNLRLNKAAVATALRISRKDSKAARWVAADALRELRGEAVQRRLASRRPAARPGRRPSS
ncbi:MAG: DNA alkylation repair protein [Candidatus Thermoplasmatota archaeon]